MESLNNDIILRITPYLDSQELLNLALTCDVLVVKDMMQIQNKVVLVIAQMITIHVLPCR